MATPKDFFSTFFFQSKKMPSLTDRRKIPRRRSPVKKTCSSYKNVGKTPLAPILKVEKRKNKGEVFIERIKFNVRRVAHTDGITKAEINERQSCWRVKLHGFV